MIRKLLILFFSLLLSVGTSQAQTEYVLCSLGFTYHISRNVNWGFGEPIITNVTPNSPADRAGLRINDIILEINGRITYQQPIQVVRDWFNESPNTVHLLVRNVQNTWRDVAVEKDCRLPNAICETQLAQAFAFFSLEDIQNRRFVLPLRTTTNDFVAFHDYRSFSFAAPGVDEDIILSARVNDILRRNLIAMGLRYDPVNPDMIVRSFFSFQPNPLFDPYSTTIGSYRPVWRLNTRTNRWERLPVFDLTEPIRITDVPFLMEFGYQFFDRRFLGPGQNPLIWEGVISDQLSDYISLFNYLEFHIPLMLKKFPNPGSRVNATYHVRNIRHNYTGISFDMNDLRTIVAVSPNSPAAIAGILPGDVVFSIQGQRFNHRNTQQLTTDYHRFIAETMNLRDPSTRFTDAHGFANAMYWDTTRYAAVSRAINNHRRYRAIFSYLFNFNRFIDPNTPQNITIEVMRNGQRLSMNVIPQIIESSQIDVF